MISREMNDSKYSVPENAIENFQEMTDHNEDIIAAMIENLQLGRYDDCMKHFSILQSNLVSLALELDNYPPNDNDPYEALHHFPDQLARSNLLDEILPTTQQRRNNSPCNEGGQSDLMFPIPASCLSCFNANVQSKICRVEKGHTELSYKHSLQEVEEFEKVSVVLEEQQRQDDQASSRMYKTESKKKWSESEKYSILVLASHFGAKEFSAQKDVKMSSLAPKIAEGMEGRTEHQVTSYIKHLNKNNPEKIIEALQKNLPPPPFGYTYPTIVAHLYPDAERESSDVKILPSLLDAQSSSARRTLYRIASSCLTDEVYGSPEKQTFQSEKSTRSNHNIRDDNTKGNEKIKYDSDRMSVDLEKILSETVQKIATAVTKPIYPPALLGEHAEVSSLEEGQSKIPIFALSAYTQFEKDRQDYLQRQHKRNFDKIRNLLIKGLESQKIFKLDLQPNFNPKSCYVVESAQKLVDAHNSNKERKVAKKSKKNKTSHHLLDYQNDSDTGLCFKPFSSHISSQGITSSLIKQKNKNGASAIEKRHFKEDNNAVKGIKKTKKSAKIIDTDQRALTFSPIASPSRSHFNFFAENGTLEIPNVFTDSFLMTSFGDATNSLLHSQPNLVVNEGEHDESLIPGLHNEYSFM